MSEALELWDYRRRVAEIYDRVRRGAGASTWERWREDRDDLFSRHPQSPIEDLSRFSGLSYFPHDRAWRTTGVLTAQGEENLEVGHSAGGATSFLRVGSVEFEVMGHTARLGLYWLAGYGGGVFLPFRDASNGSDTYGGGRYLLDTAKGADLGHEGAEIVLDFNYAYHPSCVYSSRWSCPLAPPENRLPFPVTAGERLAPGSA